MWIREGLDPCRCRILTDGHQRGAGRAVSRKVIVGSPEEEAKPQGTRATGSWFSSSHSSGASIKP